MAVAARSLKVFISYSRADVGFADQLVLALKDKGFQPILDRHDMSGGEKWRERLGKLILEADAVAFVLTATSAASEICEWEVNEAGRLGKLVLPVTPAPVDGFAPPAALKDLNWIPFYADAKIPDSGFYSGLIKLVDALSLDLDWLRLQTRLSEGALEWQRTQADERLLRGSALAEAQAWFDQKAGKAPLEIVTRFIAASHDAEQKRALEAQAQVAEREEALKAAEAAVAERQAAIDAKKKTDKLFRVLAISSVAAGLALVTAALAGLWVSAHNYSEATQRNAALFAREAKALTSKGGKGLALLVALSGDPAANKGIIERWMKPKGYAAAREALARAYATNRMVFRVATGEPVTAMTALPGGKQFISFHEGGKAHIWEIGKREPVAEFGLPADAVDQAMLTPDGKGIVLVWKKPNPYGNAPRPLPRVLNLADHTLGLTLGEQPSQAVTIDAESNSVFLSYSVSSIEQRSLDTGASMGVWTVQRGNTLSTAVWAGLFGRVLTVVDSDGGVLTWLDQTTTQNEMNLDNIDVHSAVLMDGMLVIGGENGRVYGFSGDDAGDYQVFAQEDPVAKLVAGPGSSMIMIADSGQAAVFRGNAMQPTREFGSAANISAAAFLAGDEMAATGTTTGEVIVWSLARSYEPLFPLGAATQEQMLWNAQLSADGRMAAVELSGTSGGALWRADATEVDTRLNASAISADGALIVREAGIPASESSPWGSGFRRELVQVADGKVLHTFDPAEYGFLGFLPSGHFALMKIDGLELSVWALGGKEPIRIMPMMSINAVGMDSTPDGRLMAFASSTEVLVFEAGKDEPIQRVPITGGAVIAFHPDGKRLAIADNDNRLTLWQIGSPDPAEQFSGHSDTIAAIAFNKDGSLMATGAMRGEANLWRLGHPEPIQFFDPGADVHDLVFDPDGRSVIMATENGISRWPIEEVASADAETQVRLACQRLAELDVYGFSKADVLALPILRGLPLNPCQTP